MSLRRNLLMTIAGVLTVHNETSTGVMMRLERPDARGLVVVDATADAGAGVAGGQRQQFRKHRARK
ncbi:MAG: hypothetical protein HC788_13060 [Sphingopyxis sp.]|nr:hypothetical protein [Sphingopyxis sp.]